MDLRKWQPDSRHTLSLDGEWEFYPHAFIEPDEFTRAAEHPHSYTNVPGDWKSAFPQEEASALGYGTYRLHILLNPEWKEAYPSYKLLLKNITTSARVYANGKLLLTVGEPATSKAQYTPSSRVYMIDVPAAERELDLVLQVANFDNFMKGGIGQSIKFGSPQAINLERMVGITLQLATILILLLHVIYMSILYWFSSRQKIYFYFIILLLFAAVGVSLDEDRLLVSLLSLNYTGTIKLALVTSLATSALMLKVADLLRIERKHQAFFRCYYTIALLYIAFVIATPVSWSMYSRAIGIFGIVVLSASLAIPVIIIRFVMNKDRSAIWLLLAASSIASSMFWGLFKNINYAEGGYYPFDLLIGFLGLGAYWFRNYFLNADRTAKLAERLKRSNKMKDEFLTNTSHELRTPLHGMINIAQAVLNNQNNKLTNESKSDLALIGEVGQRMSLLLQDLLDLAQLRENRLRLQLSTVRLASVANGVVGMLRHTIPTQTVQLNLEIPSTFPLIQADEQRLVQILFNLVHNAIKFTPHGSVTIHASVQGKWAWIHISDTGIGIAKDYQDRIFESYEQGDPLTSAARGGLGLGLSIVRNLVELHGGQLKLQSSPGEGSKFSFSMPLAGEQKAALDQEAKDSTYEELTAATVPLEAYDLHQAAAMADNSTGEDKIHVLAVDDDPVNLRILGNILSPEKYNVVKVGSGAEALEILDYRPWDLLIADVMMSQMSGYELARAVRERYSISELPILLLTARSLPEDIYTGFLAGANDYITKPVDSLELQYRVKAMTDLKRSTEKRLRLEAAYLQAQIQPHFLFNTLNSITALSDIDTDRMSSMIDAFSTYLKISFDYWNEMPLVPLEHELDLVKSYLYIEHERFENRLQVQISIDPEVNLQMLLPPLSIQPLVENAVRHGVLSRSKGGKVSLHITQHSNFVSFSVIDDGIGMEEGKVAELLAPSSNGRRGIGILNTDRRLKQRYGQGLTITSHIGQGTHISFNIPIR
ncbi:hybrid sensor histidine kinase/response regulator [Paenibacillus sp. CAA11]|uniref:hybrid sensor histidine kinase/response regulator n=1 Tax=Paenibacillus sp. CAA11 TaxID=1532905 RepID=UPI001F15B820|nr:ATP-binding protein [Paenibacillus sp. CAA11]